MDEDPTMTGGVGDGTTQNEPNQETQTTTAETTQVSSTEIPVAGAVEGLTTAEEPVSTDTTAEPAVNESTTAAPGNKSVELGGLEPGTTILGRENAESRHIDHDLDLGGGQTKKTKTGLIVGIIIGAVVLILGGLAIWFFAFYNNPDKVAFDAVEKLITADNVTMNGGVVVLPTDDNPEFESIILNIESSSKSLPNSTTATLLVTPSDDGENAEAIQIQLDTVYLADGIAYIKVSGLTDAAKAAGLDQEDSTAFSSALFDIVEVVDDEWWQISVPNLLDEMELSAEEADGMSAIYTCAVDAMNSDASGEIASLYKANKFINVEPAKNPVDSAGNAMTPASGYSYYQVSLGSEQLANFINALPNTAVAFNFYDCYNAAVEQYNIYEPISAEDFSEVSADDFSLPDDLSIYLEISRFGHSLRSVITEQAGEDETVSGSIVFQYEAGTTNEPEDYRPITDLFDEITELLSQIVLEDVELSGGASDGAGDETDWESPNYDDDDDWGWDDEDDDYGDYDYEDEDDDYDDWEDDE